MGKVPSPGSGKSEMSQSMSTDGQRGQAEPGREDRTSAWVSWAGGPCTETTVSSVLLSVTSAVKHAGPSSLSASDRAKVPADSVLGLLGVLGCRAVTA